MYENYKICPLLSVKEKCVRVQRYTEGEFIECFHEHVPSRRLSLDAESEALRALVGQCAGWNGALILHSRLNNRKGGPSRYPGLTSHVGYPEAGVIRRYWSAGDVTAWSDTVIVASSFRSEHTENGT